MRFTIVFRNPGPEGHYDQTLSLNFVPGPCFYRGDQMILNLAATPHLQPGGVRSLFDQGHQRMPSHPAPRECVVVVHPEGHGGPEDAELLVEELTAVGHRVHLVRPEWTFRDGDYDSIAYNRFVSQTAGDGTG